MNLSLKAKLATLCTIEKQASIAYESALKGGHTEPLHGKQGRFVVALEILAVDDDFHPRNEPTTGQWLDTITRGVNRLLTEYNLDYYINRYETVCIGTWYDEKDQVIEMSLNTSVDPLHYAMLLGKAYDQMFIYDTVDKTALNVVEYFLKGGAL